jgi:molecular chaperone GrpE
MSEKKKEKVKETKKRKSPFFKYKQTIKEKEEQIKELEDKYLRLFAEFENFKKRVRKENENLVSTASEGLMKAILPVLDDFDRAKKMADDENSTEQFSEGVTLVYEKIFSVLKLRGLMSEESTGNDFDPEIHEAIAEIPVPDESMKGKIIDTIEKGYKLNEKIIRYPKVVVGK